MAQMLQSQGQTLPELRAMAAEGEGPLSLATEAEKEEYEALTREEEAYGE